MKRKKIVAGNWKMNKTLEEGTQLSLDVAVQLPKSDTTTVLCPPFTHIAAVSAAVAGSGIHVGAQNCHPEASGAYTGEVSTSMLKSAGASYVVLGHSERRVLFGETDAFIAQKVSAALSGGLIPIFCCGELLDAREAGQQEAVVEEQVSGGLFHLDAGQFAQVVIAYEPVWAIGTGRTASPQQAQEMHRYIRSLIAAKYGDSVASATTILYGGSCKPDNAGELFSQPDVDGGLIGGASLNAADFVAIVNSMV